MTYTEIKESLEKEMMVTLPDHDWQLVATKITQARAEERERLLREIDEMKGYTVIIPVIDTSLGELTESDIGFVEHINGQILFKNKVKQNLTNKDI